MAVSARFPEAVQPLFGALLGACGAALVMFLPKEPGAVAAVVLWTAATLAKGELGFSRWFPNLPLFGTLLAGCTILLRWYSLISLQNSGKLLVPAMAAMALGPAAAIALGWVSRPVDDAAFARLSRLGTVPALIAIAEGSAAALACGLRVGTVVMLITWILLRMISYLAQWRYRGVRGSDLDAARVVVETAALVVLSSLRQLL